MSNDGWQPMWCIPHDRFVSYWVTFVDGETRFCSEAYFNGVDWFATHTNHRIRLKPLAFQLIHKPEPFLGEPADLEAANG